MSIKIVEESTYEADLKVTYPGSPLTEDDAKVINELIATEVGRIFALMLNEPDKDIQVTVETITEECGM